MQNVVKRYETDVLVLGAGAAGCGAAIAAARAGANVLLLDKGCLESSGSLGGGNDHFMCVLDQDEHDGLEDIIKYYSTPISGFSVRKAELFYQGMNECRRILEDAGIELMHREDGSYLRSLGFGQPGAWWIHIDHGFTVKPRLAAYIRKLGVQVVENVQVTRLLKDHDRIAGCQGFHILTGARVEIACKCAVMALGREAVRVSNNSTHKPFNTQPSPFVTGSQIVLSLDAGCTILGLDTQDAATLNPKGFGCSGLNGLNNMGGKEINAIGERFMGRYDPHWENCPRRNQVMGTFEETLLGSGPPFVMDMTHFSPEAARHLQYDLMPGDKETFLDYAAARDIEFTRAPMEVELSERCLGGIIRCNDELETDVANLYNACLLCSFSGSMSMGYQAGRFAAGRAAGLEMASLPEEADLAAFHEQTFRPLVNKPEKAITYTEFEDGLRQIMDYYVGFQRTDAGMRQALRSMDVLKEYEPRLGGDSLRDLMRLTESRELLRVSRLYVESCLERRENGRGLFICREYPPVSAEKDRPLAVRLDEHGQSVFSWN